MNEYEFAGEAEPATRTARRVCVASRYKIQQRRRYSVIAPHERHLHDDLCAAVTLFC